jgi:hypothetical protein
MPWMPPHAAKISDVKYIVPNLFAQIIFFILSSKPLKLFNVNKPFLYNVQGTEIIQS